MGIDHDVVLGSLGNTIEIMVVEPLPVVMLSTRNDIAYIAALHSIVAIFVHQIIGSLQMTFIVADRSRCLMVHHQANAFGVGVVVERLDIEVGIRSNEVEDIILAVAIPVFPAFVPAFDEHLAESVLGSKVDVFSHIGIVGGMQSIGLYLGIVGNPELHRRQVERVSPRLAATDHLPPYANIFDRMNPGGVLVLRSCGHRQQSAPFAKACGRESACEPYCPEHLV